MTLDVELGLSDHHNSPTCQVQKRAFKKGQVCVNRLEPHYLAEGVLDRCGSLSHLSHPRYLNPNEPKCVSVTYYVDPNVNI